MLNHANRLAVLAGCLLLGAGPPLAAEARELGRGTIFRGCENGDAAKLAKAARRAGLGIEDALVAVGAGHKGRHVVAPVEGLGNIPAFRLMDGVDFAVAHLELAPREDGTSPPLEDGDYVLRVSAGPEAIQEAMAFTRAGVEAPAGNAFLQVFSLDGELVLERPAHLQWVASAGAAGEGLGIDTGTETIGGPAASKWRIAVWVESRGSWRVCVDISW